MSSASGGAPAPADSDPSKHFALLLGIERYREYTPLKSPRRDVSLFCEWLTDKAGVPPKNIFLVPEKGEGTPVNDDILEAFDRLGVRAGKLIGTRLYIYYAGHGLGPAFNEVALLPANARIGGIQHYCFGIAKWMQYFVEMRLFDEIIMFVDCCREERDIETIGLPYEIVKAETAPATPINYFALMGSNHGGRSFEVYAPPRDPALDEAAHRGLMTEALLEGLNGAPGAIDPQSGNAVTTESLQRYVVGRVAEEAKARGMSQRVEPLALTGTPITLFTVPEAPTPPAVTLNLTIGPETEDKPLQIQDLRTLKWRKLGQGAKGTALPPLEIASDTRHQIMTEDLGWSDILDPSRMKNPHDIQLP